MDKGAGVPGRLVLLPAQVLVESAVLGHLLVGVEPQLGQRKLAPRISPGKSWEGVFGGIAAVVVYAIALVPFASRAGVEVATGATSIALWIVFIVAITALSVVGDLHESLLKRRAGVKDSGTLLPGHGGVLDRTDALLAAMPPIALATLAFVGRA